MKGTHFDAENYTVDSSKFPRFLPTSPFLVISEFYVINNSSIVYFFKARFEGHLTNLSPILLKNVFKQIKLG